LRVQNSTYTRLRLSRFKHFMVDRITLKRPDLNVAENTPEECIQSRTQRCICRGVSEAKVYPTNTSNSIPNHSHHEAIHLSLYLFRCFLKLSCHVIVHPLHSSSHFAPTTYSAFAMTTTARHHAACRTVPKVPVMPRAASVSAPPAALRALRRATAASRTTLLHLMSA
jgi:hypothetical protein